MHNGEGGNSLRDPTIEDANLGTYRAWKQDLQKNGKTPEDAVAFARQQDRGGEWNAP